MNNYSNFATSKSWDKSDLVNVTLFRSTDKLSSHPISVPVIPLAEPVVRQTPNEAVDKLKDEFHLLVKQWRKDTQHFSSVTKMVQHPAYRRIIDMGAAVLPYLLNELNQHPDHWLVALNAITGEDPAPKNCTFDEAVQAWLAWGRRKRYLQ